VWWGVALAVALASPAAAQSTLERSPNLGSAWVGRPGEGYFHFVHRFSVVGDVHKVINSPSFLLGAGLPGRALVGLVYASNSDVSPEVRPNEWELFLRWQPLGAGGAFPLRLSAQGGYNAAAGSTDGEIAAGGEVGRLSLSGTARLLSRPYAGADPRLALGGGAIWRLGRWVALGGDVVSLTDRRPNEKVAWSAGLLMAIPYTPHSLSLHATNTSTTTLQGASRGGEEVRWGFEFTVPLMLRRYFGGRTEAAAAPLPPGPSAASDTVHAAMEGLEFTPARLEVKPGTTVVWTNRSPVPHTVTGDDGRWGSPLLEPGQSWSYTFTTAGSYPFHCAPHPFMKGVVTVRE
jgi:plastocyanin